jgi:uncharacterized membrane protein
MPETRDLTPAARVTIFSDGVFAIAITLLVLDLTVPLAAHGDLTHQLARRWPNFLAYATSFLTVGVCWINHHAQSALVKRANRQLLVINLLLLMTVAFVPFPTAVMARYLREADDQSVAVSFYSLALLAIDIAFFAHWFYGSRAGLWVREPTRPEFRGMLLRNGTGAVSHAAAAGVAFANAYVGLAICALSGVHFLRPGPMAAEIAAGEEPGNAPRHVA